MTCQSCNEAALDEGYDDPEVWGDVLREHFCDALEWCECGATDHMEALES